ncbi:C39 family peptidase [Enterococcus thailandicus]|uniref:C39 family peptidase n=1 Tax=Enterococcus thailandicus TaxID=417368 RepID=UPI0035D5FBD8
MKKGVGYLVCVTLLSTMMLATTSVLAEETIDTTTNTTMNKQTIMSTYTEEQTKSSTVTEEHQVNEEVQTTIVNGEQVTVEPPVKEGQAEAEATEAPKEELQEGGSSLYARSAIQSSVQTFPMYRLFNPYSGEHFYTRDTGERDKLRKIGWNYEGVGWQAPTTGASLLQALQYKGKITNWSLTQFLNTIPKSTNGNPNTGFVGSPFVENSWTYSAIYPAPLTTWGQKYGNVQNISGSSMNILLNEVKSGNPVVAWVTINFQPIRWGNWNFGVAANNNHAVTLDGYNKGSNQVHVSDPISGSYWLSRTTFENIYNARKYAVVVK